VVATGLAEAAEIATERWRAEVAQYLPLIARVIVQTRRRVLEGEIVPASDKPVGLFEPHADIIVKGGRQVQYGHKLNLTTGKSGLILDVVIETGNLADAERLCRCSIGISPAPARRRGKPPPMVATPAAPISPPPRLAALPMSLSTRSAASPLPKWSRAHRSTVVCVTSAPGIEAAISCFKRAYGAGRCTWRGLDHFKAYIWSAVVAHNMVLFKPA
jgi:IS5 family transposase